MNQFLNTPEYRPGTHGLVGTPIPDKVALHNTPDVPFAEYPKHLNLEVADLEAQKAALVDGYSGDTVSKDFPKMFTKAVNEPGVINEPEEEIPAAVENEGQK